MAAVTTVALTANRTGIGLCALAATGCVALAPKGRAVGPVALAIDRRGHRERADPARRPRARG